MCCALVESAHILQSPLRNVVGLELPLARRRGCRHAVDHGHDSYLANTTSAPLPHSFAYLVIMDIPAAANVLGTMGAVRQASHF